MSAIEGTSKGGIKPPPELAQLQERLLEAEETLSAIRRGEVDALLIEGEDGLQTYTLTGADRPYRIMVENMQEGAVSVSEEGIVLYANQRFSQMVEIPLQQIIGHSFLMLVPEEHSAALFPLFDSRKGGSRKTEISLQRPDGNLMPVHITASEFSLDGTVFHCLVVMDLTHKRKHEQLQDMNRLLEERVVARTQEAEQRAKQLQALAGELSRAEQQERKRIAQLLHDGLQQTLVAAKMRIDLMLRHEDDDIKRENLVQVLNLLADSIASSRSLTVELSPPILFDRGLFPALDWLSRHFEEEHLLDVGLDIASDADAAIDEDIGTFLFQAVRECLFNTVKYAHTRSAHIRAYCPDESHITLEVSDNGIGCDFDRVSSKDKRGFGIFSIQQRVDLFGGHLKIDSEPNEGFFVSICVPRQAQQEPELLGAPPAVHAIQPASPVDSTLPFEATGEDVIRVLLVDDHKVLREGISLLLRSQPGLAVVGEAGDGLKALELARQLHPHIVVMDVSMPGMSGLEATRLLTREMPDIRVVALSMHESSDMASAMVEAGADIYLAKDGPAEQLVAAIRGIHAIP